jgi:hypothetical protein
MSQSTFGKSLTAAFAVASTVLLANAVGAQNLPAPTTQVSGTSTRTGVIGAIGFIDSPNAYCFQPDQAQNVCYVNWGTIHVDAAPNYMISLTIELDGRLVARNNGFFQTSMTIPASMHGQGYKMACGAKGAGGDPDWGKAYSYVIRARDSANLGSANYGTVYCPPYLYPTGR